MSSEFNQPVWYGTRKTVASVVIPNGFKYVLDNLDGLEENWSTTGQIEVLIELLQEKKEQYKFTRQVNLTSGYTTGGGYGVHHDGSMNTNFT